MGNDAPRDPIAEKSRADMCRAEISPSDIQKLADMGALSPCTVNGGLVADNVCELKAVALSYMKCVGVFAPVGVLLNDASVDKYGGQPHTSNNGTRSQAALTAASLASAPRPPPRHLPIHLPSKRGQAPGRALRRKPHNSLPPLNSTLTAEQSSGQQDRRQRQRETESKCPSVTTART